MSLKGQLQTFFLSSVLQFLCHEEKTGVLHVTNGTDEVKVILKDGVIIYAMGSDKRFRLGALLRKSGVISEDQLIKCLEEGKRTRVSLGKMLVEKGYISYKVLREFTHRQVQEILYSAFLWQDGEFEYKEAARNLDLDGVIVTELNTMSLILEASRRIDEMSVFKKQITSDELVFGISEKPQEKEEIVLNSNEWRILSLLDRQRRVADLIGASGYDEFAVYKILHSLLSFGLIEQHGGPEAGPDNGDSSALAVYAEAFRMLFIHLESELFEAAADLIAASMPRENAALSDILAVFEPGGSVDRNIEAVSEALPGALDPDDARRTVLEGFDQWFEKAVGRAAGTILPEKAAMLLREMEKLSGTIRTFQTLTMDQTRALRRIEEVLQEVRGRLGDDSLEILI